MGGPKGLLRPAHKARAGPLYAGPSAEKRFDKPPRVPYHKARSRGGANAPPRVPETQTDKTVCGGDPKRMAGGWFNRLRQGLSKTRQQVLARLGQIIGGHTRIDDEMLAEIEEVLIGADLGVSASLKIVERIREKVRDQKAGDKPEMIQALLKAEVMAILNGAPAAGPSAGGSERPHVVMVVGVNGVGKTTTIGKLARQYADEGKRVLMAAGDTFRAAGIEQLEIWAQRTGADIVRHQSGADPASVIFDALSAAKARGADVLLIDTAGRLHTQVNLMEELKKIKRVLAKQDERAPHEVLLVLDATTGQNAISQAKRFDESLGVTGIVLTKLDGTAKGGIVVAVQEELGIPVTMIGVGERSEDLRPFNAQEFVEALLA